jgi:uncharacterized protein (DUF433 family)
MGTEQRSSQVNLRLHAATSERLTERARAMRIAPATLAARYVVEGVLMDRHPRIRFSDRPGGREAMLAGTRLSVIDVVRTIQQNGGSPDEAALYLDISAADVTDVIGFYLDCRIDIDIEIELRERAEEEEQARWQARQQAFAG